MRQRIWLVVVLVGILFVMTRPAGAGQDAGVTLPPKPSTPGGTVPGAATKPSSCPHYARSGVYTQIGDGSGESYGYYEWTCDGVTWTRVWGCITGCTATGLPALVLPPDPGYVEKELEKSAPLPVGTFAPPVQSEGIAAITGLKLYAHISDDTYKIVNAPEVRTGPWFASAVETPGTIILDVDGLSVTCATNPPDPSTREGRDASECFVPITTVPEGGIAKVTLTVLWHVVITTNVPGVNTDKYVPKVSTINIRVKELQAVVESSGA
jgi:hypothetical protein